MDTLDEIYKNFEEGLKAHLQKAAAEAAKKFTPDDEAHLRVPEVIKTRELEVNW